MAMLKPHTDFGWYGGHNDMSDAAKSMLIHRRSSRGGSATNIDDDDDGLTDADEGAEKTVLEICDVGETPRQTPPVHVGMWHTNAGEGGANDALHVLVMLASHHTDMGVQISQVGGKVTRVRVRDHGRVISEGHLALLPFARVGDTLVRVGEQPVTDATTRAEVDVMLRDAVYPLALRFRIPAADGKDDDGKCDNTSTTCAIVESDYSEEMHV